MMAATPEQLHVLKEFYTIHGDGRARLDLCKALRDDKFHDRLKRLNELTNKQIEDGAE